MHGLGVDAGDGPLFGGASVRGGGCFRDTVSAEEDSDHSGTLFAVMAVITGTAVYAVLRSRRR